MASIHDLLTQEAKVNIELNSLSAQMMLEKLLPILQETVGDRGLRFEVENVRLPVRYGTALVILVNELVSNAVKHGQGLVEVSLATVDHIARLEVSDGGPGFPNGFDARSAANTGLDLVEGVARLDLRGQIAYETRREGGALVIITFPIPESEMRLET